MRTFWIVVIVLVVLLVLLYLFGAFARAGYNLAAQQQVTEPVIYGNTGVVGPYPYTPTPYVPGTYYGSDDTLPDSFRTVNNIQRSSSHH